MDRSVDELKSEIKKCTICEQELTNGCNPVCSFSTRSKIAIIGQAPGIKVHQSGKPWADQSGKKLMTWLGVSSEQFYDSKNFAIIPMGFCYPGKGKSGDLPPRKECAPLWHPAIWSKLKYCDLILLVGQYAQKYYLKENRLRTLTETVRNYKEYLPKYFPLPHPSPRNNIWLKRNDWFDSLVLPELQLLVGEKINFS